MRDIPLFVLADSSISCGVIAEMETLRYPMETWETSMQYVTKTVRRGYVPLSKNGCTTPLTIKTVGPFPRVINNLTNLPVLDLFASELHHSPHLGGDAQVLEEPLVGRPELAPHGLLHALLGLHQVGRLLELLPCADPLRHNQSVNRFACTALYRKPSQAQAKPG